MDTSSEDEESGSEKPEAAPEETAPAPEVQDVPAAAQPESLPEQIAQGAEDPQPDDTTKAESEAPPEAPDPPVAPDPAPDSVPDPAPESAPDPAEDDDKDTAKPSVETEQTSPEPPAEPAGEDAPEPSSENAPEPSATEDTLTENQPAPPAPTVTEEESEETPTDTPIIVVADDATAGDTDPAPGESRIIVVDVDNVVEAGTESQAVDPESRDDALPPPPPEHASVSFTSDTKESTPVKSSKRSGKRSSSSKSSKSKSREKSRGKGRVAAAIEKIETSSAGEAEIPIFESKAEDSKPTEPDVAAALVEEENPEAAEVPSETQEPKEKEDVAEGTTAAPEPEDKSGEVQESVEKAMEASENAKPEKESAPEVDASADTETATTAQSDPPVEPPCSTDEDKAAADESVGTKADPVEAVEQPEEAPASTPPQEDDGVAAKAADEQESSSSKTSSEETPTAEPIEKEGQPEDGPSSSENDDHPKDEPDAGEPAAEVPAEEAKLTEETTVGSDTAPTPAPESVETAENEKAGEEKPPAEGAESTAATATGGGEESSTTSAEKMAADTDTPPPASTETEPVTKPDSAEASKEPDDAGEPTPEKAASVTSVDTTAADVGSKEEEEGEEEGEKSDDKTSEETGPVTEETQGPAPTASEAVSAAEAGDGEGKTVEPPPVETEAAQPTAADEPPTQAPTTTDTSAEGAASETPAEPETSAAKPPVESAGEPGKEESAPPADADEKVTETEPVDEKVVESEPAADVAAEEPAATASEEVSPPEEPPAPPEAEEAAVNEATAAATDEPAAATEEPAAVAEESAPVEAPAPAEEPPGPAEADDAIMEEAPSEPPAAPASTSSTKDRDRERRRRSSRTSYSNEFERPGWVRPSRTHQHRRESSSSTTATRDMEVDAERLRRKAADLAERERRLRREADLAEQERRLQEREERVRQEEEAHARRRAQRRRTEAERRRAEEDRIRKEREEEEARAARRRARKEKERERERERERRERRDVRPSLRHAETERERAPERPKEVLAGDKSPGVARIEAINAHMTFTNRVIIGFGVFLIAYAYGLDGTVRYTYQSTALSTYGEHSLTATINVIRTVIAAAAQPTAAKIADVFGRVELVFLSVFFYVLGTIIEASATNVSGFCAGAIFYQIGYTVVTLLVEVIVADITSLRSRLLWSYISATPFIINTWISGDVTSAVLGATTWRWGIGMWALIYPVCAIPLIVGLMIPAHRAKKSGALAAYKTPYQQNGFTNTMKTLFWQLDVIGVILMIAVFALILAPLTLAGGSKETWKTAHIIAPLVIGLLLVPVFVLQQRWAPHPLIPFRLLKDRAVWSALGIATFLNFAWYLQGDYLYTVLIVAFDESILSATRISSLYSFVSVLTGVGLSLIVRFGVPYLKPFMVAGTLLFMVAFGLLIEYRGGLGGSSHSGVIGAQCLLGFAGGMFPYPAQTSIQSATKHEHVAMVTGLYLALYNIGSALGATVSGAIWTQVLPAKLAADIAKVSNNATLSTAWYGSPLQLIYEYPVGTPVRGAVITAYQSTQRLLAITGICLCVPLIVFALCTRNPRLTKQQSLPEAEMSVHSTDSEGSIVKEPRKGGFMRKLWQ
ncbi:hypothetical protein MBLNU459_g6327t2 [Dothideomycetes sp. NU459]